MNADNTGVTFNTSGLPYIAGTSIQLIGIDLDRQAFTIANREITEDQWEAQYFYDSILGDDYSAVAAYIYSPDQSKISSLGYAEP